MGIYSLLMKNDLRKEALHYDISNILFINFEKKAFYEVTLFYSLVHAELENTIQQCQ